MNKPKIIAVKEKKIEERKPPSEEEYEFILKSGE